MSAPNFVRKTGTDGLDPVAVGDQPVIQAYPELRRFIAEHRGPEAAGLFAEPVTTSSPGNDAAPVSWYAAMSGDPRTLATLDAEAREQPEALLRRRLADLAPLLDDPRQGHLVRAALNIASVKDILVIGDQPVLTNWGLLPQGLIADETARRDHFARTLGAYAPFGAPPLNFADRNAPTSSVAAAGLAGAAALAAGADSAQAATATSQDGAQPPPPPLGSSTDPGVGDAGGGNAPPPRGQAVVVDVPWHRRPWLPVLIAVIAAVALLVFLLLPGVLIYPERAVAENPDLDTLIALQRENNRSLEEQIRRLEEALEAGVCTIQDPRQGIPATIVPDVP